MALGVAVARLVPQNIGCPARDRVQLEIPAVLDGIADELETLLRHDLVGRAAFSELGCFLRDIPIAPVDVFS